jgi:hypothetical protein
MEMLEAFLAGPNRSINAANEIESYLLGEFPDDDGFEDLLIAVASYQPGGGEYLYDQSSVRPVISDAIAEVEARLMSTQ